MGGAQVVDVKPNIFRHAIADQVLVLELVFAHVQHVPICATKRGTPTTLTRCWIRVTSNAMPAGYICTTRVHVSTAVTAVVEFVAQPLYK